MTDIEEDFMSIRFESLRSSFQPAIMNTLLIVAKNYKPSLVPYIQNWFISPESYLENSATRTDGLKDAIRMSKEVLISGEYYAVNATLSAIIIEYLKSRKR